MIGVKCFFCSFFDEIELPHIQLIKIKGTCCCRDFFYYF